MKTLIIIPAYQEAGSIVAVIKDLKSHGYRDLIVIDDGSVDKTGMLAKKTGVRVFRHIVNRGLGAALGTGFDYAKSKNVDALVTFDADGQHKAKDINNLLIPILRKKADVVIGSRLINSKGMPIDRKIWNYLSNFLTLALYGIWTTDSLSGLRAFNKRALNLIQIKTDRMEVSNEFLKEIKRNKLHLVEIPIKPIYTSYSQSTQQSNLNGLTNGLKMLIRLFR